MKKEEREKLKQEWREKVEKIFPTAIKYTDCCYKYSYYTISIRRYGEPVVRNDKTKYQRKFTNFVENLEENIKIDKEFHRKYIETRTESEK